jgi:FkbM family methyltransferase
VSERDLDALLAEDPRAARERGASAFARARGARPVVLVGAGNLGRRIAAAIREAGSAPVAFADGQRALHFTRVDGIEVRPVESVVESFPDAAYVVTIWGARSDHRIAKTISRLRALGARCVIPFTHLLWSLESLLPYYFVARPERLLADADAIRRAFELFTDEQSRAEFITQVRARLSGDLTALSEPIAGSQYHAPGLFTYRESEVVVDGGAYDADTLKDWLQARGPRFSRWIAVEPDPGNAARFEEFVAGMPAELRTNVRLRRVALGAESGSAVIDGSGAGARVANRGDGPRVDVTTIEALTRDEHATFIKLDIEGTETLALKGGRNAIARDRPVLAVCAYHLPDDFYALPLLIASMTVDYEFFLRPHGAEGWDLVLYAVPKERRP